MTLIGNISGQVEGGSDLKKSIDVDTEAISQHSKGRLTLTGGATATIDIPQGQITELHMVWLKSVLASDETILNNLGTLILTDATGTGTSTLDNVCSFFHVCNPKSDQDLSKISVLPGASDQVLEYILAGD